MASGEKGQPEIEAENPEDPVKELIRLVENAILRQEELEFVSEMVKYRRNLSRPMFSHLQDLEGKPVDMEEIL